MKASHCNIPTASTSSRDQEVSATIHLPSLYCFSRFASLLSLYHPDPLPLSHSFRHRRVSVSKYILPLLFLIPFSPHHHSLSSLLSFIFSSSFLSKSQTMQFPQNNKSLRDPIKLRPLQTPSLFLSQLYGICQNYIRL